MANSFVSVTSDQLATIQSINAQQMDKHMQIQPVQLNDGTYVLNADTANATQLYAAWASVLTLIQAQPITVQQSDFKVPALPPIPGEN